VPRRKAGGGLVPVLARCAPKHQKAAKFAQCEMRYSLCGICFSVGAILFRRAFAEQIGGLKLAWQPGVLGIDEDILCRDCVSCSRPMYIIENILSGHFSFHPQESLMREKLPELSALDPETFPPSAPWTRRHIQFK
jgi:hypothetical protein